MNDDRLRSAFDDLLHDLPADRGLPPATARRVFRRRGLKTSAVALGGAGAVATAAVLLLSGPEPDDRVIGPARSPSASPSVAASPSAEPSAQPSPADGAQVVLRPDGLSFPDGSSTSALTFGSAASTVRDALDRRLGAGGEAATPDCGPEASVVQYDGGLFLRLQGGRFVGWTSGSPGLSTADGIGVGSTLAELRAALPDITVSDGSLGPEWSTESGLAGFLDGTEDSSRVNSIGAGDRCLAR